ncbi:o-succinylbenzoate--CoA ligase [Calidifontibacter indicus]|uniref:O-succinylbenzoic acid--CoA ligase n=1 Tax=Calidifontibacter indicus TaxID=419650 RepID=A0A3D9UQ35_9MICO|nr:o-succinylbenzoate--CoA ligase [Calidifontibacter indicus]REF30100.1 O-succinylbenzoic acid--CoA ligase [Calidifontibacter indicus]
MRPLVPFPVDAADLRSYRRALLDALEGGPAVAPLTDAGPPDHDRVPDGVALVVSTSGSTGRPKRAMLTAENLRASATATHARLGGPGQWLLPMPPQHIAGTQVIVRSIVAGTVPVTLASFGIDEFVQATGELTAERCYTSLVPTQLVRLLEAGRGEALRRYDAILLGGAASPPALLERSADAGVRVCTTYGMSETAGGCVYDGQPLDGTTVELDDDRITLRGSTVALGYLGDPELTEQAFDGAGGFRTGDLGTFVDGRLQVLGRADDLINTGGMKVAPRVVEDVLTRLPGVREAVVLGLPDPEWGQVVSAALVADPRPSLRAVREALRDTLPGYALPRRLLLVDALPLRGPGKPDRVALAASDQWQNWATSPDAAT